MFLVLKGVSIIESLNGCRFNDVELKFWWPIPIVGKRVNPKERMKIYYFISSMLVQIGFFCMHIFEH